jgi:hypothetical protein
VWIDRHERRAFTVRSQNCYRLLDMPLAWSVRSVVLLAGTVALAALVACGPLPERAGGAGEGGGEAALVKYTDAQSHYSVMAPGRLTQQPDGSAAFVGPSERVQVSVIQGAGAADLNALAQSEINSLSTSTQGFRVTAKPGPFTVAGHRGLKFTYTWSEGASAVTGKPTALTSVRYYIPKDSATVAVLTYGTATAQFDPQGADDIANTFKWQ